MTRLLKMLVGTMLLLGAVMARDNGSKKPAYPAARTTETADVYHGVTVRDPYRWMEDLESSETSAWAKAQDDFGASHLQSLPTYEKFRSRVAALTDYETVSTPLYRGGKYFFTRVPKGGKARAVIEVSESEAGPSRVLMDGNQLPSEETLGAVLPSYDGKIVAFGISRNSSNWYELRFLDVKTGKRLPDVLRGLNASSLWWKGDNSGIYYSAFPAPTPGKERTQKLENQRGFFHAINTQQVADKMLFAAPEHPDWRVALRETDDGKYLVVTTRVSSKNGVYIMNAQAAGADWTELIPLGESTFVFRGNSGPIFWLQTNADAPRSRVIAVDIRNPARGNWKDIIPESADTLSFANLVDRRFICVYVQDARHIIKVFREDGAFERELRFPDLGTTFSGFVGRPADRHTFYSFNSAAYAGGATVFRLDARSGNTRPFRQPKLSYRPSDYETQQVFYKSKDGTRVPMFISWKKGTKPNGNLPVFLYAYGALGFNAIPFFQPQVLAWMEAGGIYAMACARGGGEYGEEWHQAGTRRNKQNTIDDYIAAAEWLIANGYTRKERLAINGGSLSSPLAGAALVQRPELFGAVLMDISVTDMVRYDHFTGGTGWRSELGSTANPEEFRALLAYSPYHNLKPGTCYPPTLITAGERDETTVPSHSYKFVAALQSAQSCSNPTLLQIMWGTGHVLGSTREQSSEILGRQLAFLAEALKMEDRTERRD